MELNKNFFAGQKMPCADLRGKQLPGFNFTRTDLSESRLIDANLAGANLTDADLTMANLRGANLTGANLTRANLQEAGLTGTNLTGANLTGANLTYAKIRQANLTGADLTGATLTGAMVVESDLTNTNLTGADLEGTQVEKVKLIGACLNWAKIKDTSFYCVNFTGADFRNAQIEGINTTFYAITYGVNMTADEAMRTDFSTIKEPISISAFSRHYHVILFPSHPSILLRIGCKAKTRKQWEQTAAEFLGSDHENAGGWDIYNKRKILLDVTKHYESSVILLPAKIQK